MRQSSHQLSVATSGKGFYEISGEVRAFAAGQAMASGVLTVFVQHTSASLIIQENADPDVQRDLADFLERLAPEDESRYRHRAEGPDDMPAHIRAALTQTSLSIPLAGGEAALGLWQGVYLVEHRARPHQRQVLLHLIGE